MSMTPVQPMTSPKLFSINPKRITSIYPLPEQAFIPPLYLSDISIQSVSSVIPVDKKKVQQVLKKG